MKNLLNKGKQVILCGDFNVLREEIDIYPENLRDPVKIEKILTELIEPSEGSDFCHRIVFFGREVCSARSPACDGCPLSDICAKGASKWKKN